MAMKHSFKVRWRAFAIWQKLGWNPWEKPKESKKNKQKGSSGDFYKGAFDSIPFLNEGAKRTFRDLLLRPGYMIRDYIGGQHDRYLAPLAALIIFYAFFTLVSSVLEPVQKGRPALPDVTSNLTVDSDDPKEEWGRNFVMNTMNIVRTGVVYLHLDQYPEEVDTRHEKALAALEGTLRAHGIPLFLGQFILLWLAMSIALRRQKVSMSACAAASAYILCQFSFFMLFAVLLTFGKSASINVLLMLVLLVFDYCGWLGIDRWKSFRLSLSTGLWYGLLFGAGVLLLGGAVALAAYLKS